MQIHKKKMMHEKSRGINLMIPKAGANMVQAEKPEFKKSWKLLIGA